MDPGAAGQDLFAGYLYAWWRGDPIPDLPPLPGLEVVPTHDVRLPGRQPGLETAEIERRLASGNVPYLALLEGQPVAHGWSARRSAGIGELAIQFELAPSERYLWDFVTLREYRGRGIYPRLLQAILEAESLEAEHFWIGHEPGNLASARGIEKAGFDAVGEVWVRGDQPVFVSRGRGERAAAGAALLRMPMLASPGPRIPPP